MNTNKQCIKCNTNKSISEYYTNKNGKDGLHSWCKCCVKARAKLTTKQNNYKHQKDYHNRTKPYLYILEDKNTKEFYIGSTIKKWCKRGTGHKFFQDRSKDDVSVTQMFYDTELKAREKEKEFIDLHIDDPLCINQNRVKNVRVVGAN